MSSDDERRWVFREELLDGEIAMWIDAEWNSFLRAQSPHGDPVELTVDELRLIRDAIDRMLAAAASEPGL